MSLNLLFSAIFSPFCALREIKDNSISSFILLLFNYMKRSRIEAVWLIRWKCKLAGLQYLRQGITDDLRNTVKCKFKLT